MPETTKRLYWQDPYRKEFDASILAVEGNEVVLDQTCFYPQGGGQVSDTGTIDSTRVVHVDDRGDSGITHILEKPFQHKVGDAVHGVIDWDKRYRTMRLHSVSHILYYLMQEAFPGVKPASSGLVDEKKDRTDYLFEVPLDLQKLKEAERKVNDAVEEGREIKTWNDRSQDGKRMWKLEPFPVMMCGGTHVRNTKEIGKVTISKGKKPGRGKERIEITLNNEATSK
jgi:Ser-tRNA(Ala) deacylase AlaX